MHIYGQKIISNWVHQVKFEMMSNRKCPNCGEKVTFEQAKAMVNVVKMLEQNKVRTPYRGAMKCHECGCQISFSLK